MFPLNFLAGANRNSAITQLESAARPQSTTEMHEIQENCTSFLGPIRHRNPLGTAGQPKQRPLSSTSWRAARTQTSLKKVCCLCVSLAHVAHEVLSFQSCVSMYFSLSWSIGIMVFVSLQPCLLDLVRRGFAFVHALSSFDDLPLKPFG